jgi:hypothetical protein
MMAGQHERPARPSTYERVVSEGELEPLAYILASHTAPWLSL